MVVPLVMGPSCCSGSSLALVALMSLVMPGQKTDASAFDVMADVPWWAACRADRHEGRREGGMTILSL